MDGYCSSHGLGTYFLGFGFGISILGASLLFRGLDILEDELGVQEIFERLAS